MLLFKVVHNTHRVFLYMKTYIMIIYTWPTFTINFKWKYSLDNKTEVVKWKATFSRICVLSITLIVVVITYKRNGNH